MGTDSKGAYCVFLQGSVNPLLIGVLLLAVALMSMMPV